jgi:hypothetical protein
MPAMRIPSRRHRATQALVSVWAAPKNSVQPWKTSDKTAIAAARFLLFFI